MLDTFLQSLVSWDREVWGAVASYRWAVGRRGGQLVPRQPRMCVVPPGRGGLQEAHGGGDQAGAGEQQESSGGAVSGGHAGGGNSSERAQRVRSAPYNALESPASRAALSAVAPLRLGRAQQTPGTPREGGRRWKSTSICG